MDGVERAPRGSRIRICINVCQRLREGKLASVCARRTTGGGDSAPNRTAGGSDATW